MRRRLLPLLGGAKASRRRQLRWRSATSTDAAYRSSVPVSLRHYVFVIWWRDRNYSHWAVRLKLPLLYHDLRFLIVLWYLAFILKKKILLPVSFPCLFISRDDDWLGGLYLTLIKYLLWLPEASFHSTFEISAPAARIISAPALKDARRSTLLAFWIAMPARCASLHTAAKRLRSLCFQCFSTYFLHIQRELFRGVDWDWRHFHAREFLCRYFRFLL